MNTLATPPTPSDTALLPPLGASALRVGYRVHIVSRDGTFVDWQGLFDLPGALTESPQADELTILSFNQLLDVTLMRGVAAVFCKKLHDRADEILKAQVAKQPPACSSDPDSIFPDDYWQGGKERVAKLMEAERLAGLPMFPSSPPLGLPNATGHPLGSMTPSAKDDLNGPREDPWASLKQQAAKEANVAEERMRAKNATTAESLSDALLHPAPPLLADATLEPAKRSRRRSEVPPKKFEPASSSPSPGDWDAPPLAKAA